MNVNIVVKEIISQMFVLNRKITNVTVVGSLETCKTFIRVSKSMAVPTV